MTTPRTIIVSKVGSVFRPRTTGSNSKGEQGETEGLIRYLLSQGYRVIYFGHAQEMGELEALGATHVAPVRPKCKGYFALNLTQAQQDAGFDEDAQALITAGAADAIAWISVLGYASGLCLVDNPKFGSVQDAAVLYIAPVLAAQSYFIKLTERRMAHIAVNNDPRTYLRTQEFTLTWPEILPNALLDQSSHERQRIIGGVHVTQRARYAACESWGHLETVENRGETDCIVVAHAHIGDGCRKKARDGSWRNVLIGAFEELPELAVYGKGWEHFSLYDKYPDRFPGVISGGDVIETLACCRFSPCVAADVGFYTGKPYVLHAAGVIPLMYGDGSDPFTWDIGQRIVPFDHPTRVKCPGDLARVIREMTPFYSELLEYFTITLQPDFTALDDCLSSVADETHLKNPDGFWEEFGGYRLP